MTVFAVVAAVIAHASPAFAAAKITKQTPAKGPAGTLLHVEGTGCPPPSPGNPSGTFELLNFTGITLSFTSKADGSFAFDYRVLPTEAGQQNDESSYPSELFCASTNKTVSGPNFAITGPTFTLTPATATRGETVRIKGIGCVQDGPPSEDAAILVAGNEVKRFKVAADFSFSTTFTVPDELAEDREHIVQVDCLIQRLESAAGVGAQRALGAQLLLVEPGAVVPAPTTTTEPPKTESNDVPAPLLAAAGVAALAVLAFTIARLRRREAAIPEPVMLSQEDHDAASQVREVSVPAPEPEQVEPQEVEPEEVEWFVFEWAPPKWSRMQWAPMPWTRFDWAPMPWMRFDWAPPKWIPMQWAPEPEVEWMVFEWAPPKWIRMEWALEPEVEWMVWDWAPEPEPEPEPIPEPVRPRRTQPLKATRVYPDYADNDGVSELEPPYAPRRPHELVAFGDVRVDNYYWMRDRDNPEVIAYLEAENAYTNAMLAPLADLQKTLFDTIKSRVKEDDTSPPVPLRAWEYYVRTAEGAEYPDTCRRPRGGGEETVILDRNAMAKGHDYLSAIGPVVSPNDNRALYAVDFDGDEKYTIKVRNLRTLEDLGDELPGTSGNMCWVNDDVFLYVMLDDAHRPYQVRRHVIGSAADSDDVIYEDNDDRFFVQVDRDLAGRFVFVRSGSKITNEDHFLAVDDPFGPLTVVEPRINGIEYETSDDGENFVILTNADGATDFKVVSAPVDRPGRRNWIDLLPHRPGTRVNEVWPFKSFIAIGERRDALNTIRLIDRASGNNFAMAYDQEVYDAQIDANREFDTETLRYTFTSLNVPLTYIDHNVATGESHIVKRTEVPNVDLDNYVCVREWATADDGTVIPMSILHHKNFVRDGNAPGLLYGYGSYEISIDPDFRVSRLNFVDHGLVYAIAHIRGGGEMGRSWYENGKFLKKRNTFTDFVACARHLVEQRWVAKGRLAARGGSAGGLLMGAVANLAPTAFNTIVAEVPFVDVVTTMSDETIPLTVTEWEEWGNPRDNADDYQYMKSYSPVDNVVEKDYPAIYVEAGLNDPRVQYWEPAKWVAKLRVTKTDDNPLLLKTEMGAGHGGPSGRYQAWDDEARVQAFVLSRLGADGSSPSR